MRHRCGTRPAVPRVRKGMNVNGIAHEEQGIMNTKLRTLFTGLAIAGIALVATPSVEAASIRVYDGTTTIIIDDNQVGPDLDPNAGVIVHVGSIGVFTLDFEIGVTKPVFGTSTAPIMVLNAGATSNAAGTLIIDFSETGFGPTGSAGSLAFAVGEGASSGTVAYNTYYDPANALFGGIPVTTDGPDGPGLIVFGATGSLPPTDSFSLTQRLIITHTAAGSTIIGGENFDAAVLALVQVPDGGFAVGLLGFALIGVEGLRRKYTRL